MLICSYHAVHGELEEGKAYALVEPDECVMCADLFALKGVCSGCKKRARLYYCGCSYKVCQACREDKHMGCQD
jgi:hypothetical protein